MKLWVTSVDDTIDKNTNSLLYLLCKYDKIKFCLISLQHSKTYKYKHKDIDYERTEVSDMIHTICAFEMLFTIYRMWQNTKPIDLQLQLQ